MHCMKCGVEIDAQQVFCVDCLADMDAHPVKADTPVVLPPKAFETASKRPVPHRRFRRPEEATIRMKNWLKFLVVLCLLLSLALGLCVTWILYFIKHNVQQPPDPGQNYSTGSFSSSSQTTNSTAPTGSTGSTGATETTDLTN